MAEMVRDPATITPREAAVIVHARRLALRNEAVDRAQGVRTGYLLRAGESEVRASRVAAGWRTDACSQIERILASAVKQIGALTTPFSPTYGLTGDNETSIRVMEHHDPFLTTVLTTLTRLMHESEETRMAIRDAEAADKSEEPQVGWRAAIAAANLTDFERSYAVCACVRFLTQPAITQRAMRSALATQIEAGVDLIVPRKMAYFFPLHLPKGVRHITDGTWNGQAESTVNYPVTVACLRLIADLFVQFAAWQKGGEG